MKFRDINLKEDYFGHGYWTDNSIIYSYNKDRGCMMEFNCCNNEMTPLRDIHLEKISFNLDEIMFGRSWFVLKRVFKSGEDSPIFEWEMWR